MSDSISTITNNECINSCKKQEFYSLSNFIIQNKIGQGHYGNVYRAVSIANNFPVALKLLQLSDIDSASNKLDLKKEIDLLKQLNHPNVVTYLASFMERNELCIVLELADAEDFSKMITDFKKRLRLIPEQLIWKYFMQICAGLEHMHSKSIMHRDIKPENILLTSAGLVKLSDLGFGRYISPNTEAALTLLGTPFYMSPERIFGQPYTFSSDIWSLGCVLYELAALQSPFFGNNMNYNMLCRRIERCDYAPIPSDVYSEKMEDLVAGCISLNPIARPNVSVLHKSAQDLNNSFNKHYV